jgi:hypothetical protein
LADQQRDGGPVTLVFCWAHWRRGFVEIDEGSPAPIAHEALERISTLYAIENRIRGRNPDERRAIRQTETRPLVESQSHRAFIGADRRRVHQTSASSRLNPDPRRGGILDTQKLSCPFIGLAPTRPAIFD